MTLTQTGNSDIHINHEGDGDIIAAAAGGFSFNPRDETCITRRRDGAVLGGMIYSSYTGRSLEMHVAAFGPNWISKDLLWVAFHYPFVQLGCEKVFARVQASNAAALRMDKHLGFEFETTIKDVYPDGDLLVLSMYRDKCRWLALKPRNLISNREGKVEQAESPSPA